MGMDQITNKLPGIIAIHDNICVFGKTREEHNTNLLQLIKTASKMGQYLTVTNAELDNCKLHSMVQFSLQKE